MIDDKILDELLCEYYKLFPNAHFFPEWYEIANKDKIKMLREAIRDKKDITQTKLYDKYQEKIIS